MTRDFVTFSPGDSTPAQKRALRREAARAVRDEKLARSTRKDRSLPEPAVAGPFGPGIIHGGYWNLAKTQIPPHQATSQHIAGIYPFVADSGLGHRGPVIGVDLNADALCTSPPGSPTSTPPTAAPSPPTSSCWALTAPENRGRSKRSPLDRSRSATRS